MRLPIDYEVDISPFIPDPEAQRIRELSIANKRLADRVELWQWISFAAMGIAMVAVITLITVVA